MKVTDALISKIRTLLNDEIPTGGTVTDVLFSNEAIADVLQVCSSENHTLYILWTQKAGLIQKDAGTIKKIQAGGETIEKYTIKDYIDLCLTTAKGYKDLWGAEKESIKNENQSFMIFAKQDRGLW